MKYTYDKKTGLLLKVSDPTNKDTLSIRKWIFISTILIAASVVALCLAWYACFMVTSSFLLSAFCQADVLIGEIPVMGDREDYQMLIKKRTRLCEKYHNLTEEQKHSELGIEITSTLDEIERALEWIGKNS